jgi:hypothetical protein
MITIGNVGTILQSGRFETILEPPRFAGGIGFTLPFQGVLNGTYQIESSTNLMNWLNLLTFTNRSERGEFTDTNALQFPRQFYRLNGP